VEDIRPHPGHRHDGLHFEGSLDGHGDSLVGVGGAVIRKSGLYGCGPATSDS
jgi:hypothetical protein